ncbi:omega gliadin, putative [Trichomonas vaginalis G3]|uniref:Omega gliadin, putative n=1 Tax=Trichomonas vaginalis (strain ATCC PRA-98 / G3) TaxID=412133 RepID=A2DPE7_TRIV3|nr:hypothetical protein TVAGG3_0680910 [Trichomonas vaginalis G3]EAY17691.1 omega gliadin, putative [Trichomonas vaginalis G3]KAI5507905.1 hypothetical protein TVAGG3_0680910 [Trichomonas vaginalis G3]|eukprot:XP_001329826.1 omega gliadin [Trichomonas vaginalis G3]
MTTILRYTPDELITLYKPSPPPPNIESFGPVKFTGNFQPLQYFKPPKKKFYRDSLDPAKGPIPAFNPVRANRFSQNSQSPPPNYFPKNSYRYQRNASISENEADNSEPVYSFEHVIDQPSSGSDLTEPEFHRTPKQNYYNGPQQPQQPPPNQPYQQPTIFNPQYPNPGFSPYYNQQYMNTPYDQQMYQNQVSYQQFQLMQQFFMFQAMQNQVPQNPMEQFEQFQKMYGTMLNFQLFQQMYASMINYPPGYAPQYQPMNFAPPPQQNYTQTPPQPAPETKRTPPRQNLPPQFQHYVPSPQKSEQTTPSPPRNTQNSSSYQSQKTNTKFSPKKEQSDNDDYSDYSSYYSEESEDEYEEVFAAVTEKIPAFAPKKREDAQSVELPPPVTKRPNHDNIKYYNTDKYSNADKYAPYYPKNNK